MNIEDLQNIKAKLIFQNLLLDHTFVHRLISVDIFKGEGPVLGVGKSFIFFFFPNKLGFLPSGEQVCPMDSASCLTKTLL